MGPRVPMEEEKKRSGVKTQRRREGTGAGVGGEEEEEEEGGAACTWKRRTLWFSMRERRRAESHFWGAKEVGVRGVRLDGGGWGEEEADGEGSWERPRHHFQRRWPEAVRSGAPRMWLQRAQWIAVSEI